MNWWTANGYNGWASCPITENGVVRILSSRGYASRHSETADAVIERLTEFISESDHEFWPDDISIRNSAIFANRVTLRSSGLTDLYLLALATSHDGRLVTFDRGIIASAIAGSTPENLIALG